MALILFCHLVNVIVAGLLPFLLLSGSTSPGIQAVYGPDTPARRILACLYGAIALASAYALIGWAWLEQPGAPATVGLVLFPFQVAYKLATLATLGGRNPVVQANLAIAALHAGGLWYILREL